MLEDIRLCGKIRGYAYVGRYEDIWKDEEAMWEDMRLCGKI
jgi:hypothetical protein